MDREDRANIKWDIRREGRAWLGDGEGIARLRILPEKTELIRGRLFWSDEDRTVVLSVSGKWLLCTGLGLGSVVFVSRRRRAGSRLIRQVFEITIVCPAEKLFTARLQQDDFMLH
jgi:hypothetical protein